MWGSDLYPHERAARVIRLVGWITLLLGLASTAAVFYPSLVDHKPLPPVFWVIALLMIGLPVLMIVIAWGLFAHKPWARTAGIVYGVLALFGFPVGTFIGAYVLWQLRKGWPVDSPAYRNPWSRK
jgi:amino acid transporter